MPDMPWPTTPDGKPVPLNQLPKTTRLVLFKQAAARVVAAHQREVDAERDVSAVRHAFNEEWPSLSHMVVNGMDYSTEATYSTASEAQHCADRLNARLAEPRYYVISSNERCPS